jgi:hypothetical protein
LKQAERKLKEKGVPVSDELRRREAARVIEELAPLFRQ